MNYSAWFESVYPELSGYGLWLRGGEQNTLPPHEFESRPFRVLIARLSTYRDTVDSFTHTLLYQILRRIGGLFPDLAYLPPPKDAVVMDRDGVPWLLGATSKRGARDFSVIAFSISIVQELLNVRTMLKKSSIPLSKRERMADPSLPLIIAGGASALYSSILWNDDPLLDGIFIGDDADAIGRLFRICGEESGRGLIKNEILDLLTVVPGFITPDGARRTTVFRSAALPREQLLEKGPVLWDEASAGRGNLQISEGCACFCGFCAESFIRKPYREFEAPVIREAALRLKAGMGVDDLELYSFNFSMHRDFYRILWELSALFPSVGLKSQRFDAIARDPELLDCLHAVGKTSLTCGMEGISQRLRRYLHKGLDETILRKSLSALLAAPLRELKIFLLATGLEGDADFEEFKLLLDHARAVMQAASRRPRLIFSMTILVRFPWTPLEFEDAPAVDVCRSVLRRTEHLVRSAGFEFRASSGSADYLLSQIMVRAADHRIGMALARALDETGFIYYREIPEPFLKAACANMEHLGICIEETLGGFPPEARREKPWSVVDTGINEKFLISRWEAAKVFVDRGYYCTGGREKEGCRTDCGACGGHTAAGLMPGRPAPKMYTIRELRDRLHQTKTREVALHFRVKIAPSLRGAPRKAAGVVLARACMLADKRLIEGYRGFEGSFVFDRYSSNWLVGDDVLALRWNDSAAELVNGFTQDAEFIQKMNETMAGKATLIGTIPPGKASIVAITFASPFRFDPSPYFAAKAIRQTMHRQGSGSYRYMFSKDSLKKNILFDCTLMPAEGGEWLVTVLPGPKFRPEEFTRAAFQLPHERDWVKIMMTATL